MKNTLTILSVTLLAQISLAENKVCASADVEILKKCDVVTFLVAGGIGGGTDKVMRDLSSKMSGLGVKSIVENKGGANGHLAAVDMKNNTNPCRFLVASNANISLNTFNKNLKPAIDPLKDFTPVSLVTKSPFLLMANKKKDALGEQMVSTQSRDDYSKNLNVFLKSMKDYSLFFGSSGVNSMSHLLSAKLESEVLNGPGKKAEPNPFKYDTHVPYTGSSAASLGVAGEQVNYFFESPETVYKTLKSRPKDVIILGATSEDDISIKIGKEPELVIPSLKSLNPALKNMVASPYVGILASKGTSEKFATNSKAIENLVNCIASESNFKKPYTTRGYQIGDTSAEALKKEMSAYSSKGEWATTMVNIQGMDSQREQLNTDAKKNAITPSSGAKSTN